MRKARLFVDGSAPHVPSATTSMLDAVQEQPSALIAAADGEEDEQPGVQRWVVPSEAWPTLQAAVEQAGDGTRIKLQSGYKEELSRPLILDRAVFIEGARDGSSRIVGEESIIVAAGGATNTVLLRRLQIHITCAPALVIAGGCTIQCCEVRAAGVGIEVAAHAGRAVHVLRSVVRDCDVGISLAGAASGASLEGSRVERCARGVAVTGLDVEEGWSNVLGSLTGVTLSNNVADLFLRGWSVKEKASGLVRRAPPGEELSMRGWPKEDLHVVAPTDRGPVVLAFSQGRVNAALFDDEEEEAAEVVEEAASARGEKHEGTDRGSVATQDHVSASLGSLNRETSFRMDASFRMEEPSSGGT